MFFLYPKNQQSEPHNEQHLTWRAKGSGGKYDNTGMCTLFKGSDATRLLPTDSTWEFGHSVLRFFFFKLHKSKVLLEVA